MNDAEIKALIERLRQRTNSGHMLLTDPPRPAPDVDCHAAADLLEQHLATKQELSDFKQEVSDALHVWYDGTYPPVLDRFIIPAPKPDPLVEAMADCGVDRFESWADQLRAALDARGFEIREKNDD